MHSEGLVTSKLRPKPEDCYVEAKSVTAFWNKVHQFSINNISVFLYDNVRNKVRHKLSYKASIPVAYM